MSCWPAAAALAAALCAWTAGARAQDGHPPPGHTRALAVSQTATSPVIDGKLDDPAWESAPRAQGFWISAYDRAPTEATEVRALADDAALYFAFTCRDARPAEIHAEQRGRDADLFPDDHVTVQLDPYHNHRQISEFSVNARGTQSDAMAGGRARKIEWKGDWQAAAARTAEGWTAELRIPFAILNFQPGARVFGVNFVRFHHRTQQWSRWADVTAQSLPEEMGHLTDLAPPRAARGSARKLTLMPYASAGQNTLDKRGTIRPGALATAGLDLRYDLAGNLAGVFSANPDFSQVEEDVLGLAFDYNEKFRSDNRPFFQEGSAFFPQRGYFYSRRLPTFDVGLKSFGKFGPVQLGVLGAQSPGGRRDWAAQVLRELGPTASAGVSLVGTDRPGFENHLIAVGAQSRWNRRLAVSGSVATTATPGRSGDAASRNLSLAYHTPYWQAGLDADRMGADYLPANGFLREDRPDTRGRSAWVNYGREFAGGALRRVGGGVSDARRDTEGGLLQSRSLTFYGDAETRSDVQISLSTTRGPYRPRDRDTGEWSPGLNNDRLHTVGLYFDTRSDRRGYGLTYSWGFLGGGRYSDLLPSLWLKPTPRTYLSYSYERAESFGVSTQNIVSLSWEISPEQAISARWVRFRGEGGGHFYRLAFRRQVRRGIDVFAVFNADPFSPERFTIKLVRTIIPSGGS